MLQLRVGGDNYPDETREGVCGSCLLGVTGHHLTRRQTMFAAFLQRNNCQRQTRPIYGNMELIQTRPPPTAVNLGAPVALGELQQEKQSHG